MTNTAFVCDKTISPICFRVDLVCALVIVYIINLFSMWIIVMNVRMFVIFFLLANSILKTFILQKLKMSFKQYLLLICKNYYYYFQEMAPSELEKRLCTSSKNFFTNTAWLNFNKRFHTISLCLFKLSYFAFQFFFILWLFYLTFFPAFKYDFGNTLNAKGRNLFSFLWPVFD